MRGLPATSSGERQGNTQAGPLYCAYNDSPTSRTPLVIASSLDEGRRWRRLATVEKRWDRQYAYPTMLEAADG
jgi:hypothetical protein